MSCCSKCLLWFVTFRTCLSYLSYYLFCSVLVLFIVCYIIGCASLFFDCSSFSCFLYCFSMPSCICPNWLLSLQFVLIVLCSSVSFSYLSLYVFQSLCIVLFCLFFYCSHFVCCGLMIKSNQIAKRKKRINENK